MHPYILVVEDDHLQEDPVTEYLENAFLGSRVESIATELQFRKAILGFSESKPDVVILDAMLKWTAVGPHVEPMPKDVDEGGFHRAGLRCAQLLASDARLRSIPVILYTILERTDLEQDGVRLPDNSVYLRKTPDMDVLARKVRERLPSER